jgi:hypothetical protein
MTKILNSVHKLLLPIAISALMVGGAIALTTVAPAFVGEAHAQELTTDDFLSSDFADETGLGNRDIKESIGGLIKSALGFLGIIAFVIVMYGGFIYMTAQGDETKLKKAQGIIVSGAIGLAIIFSAYAITTFIVSELIGATTGVTAS